MDLTIKVIWQCGQTKRRCLNKERPGCHPEEQEAARCVFQDAPDTLACWIETNYRIPTVMEFKPESQA